MNFRRWMVLAGIGFAGVLLHAAVLSIYPVQQTLGDEASYTLEAHRMLDTRWANLLPGNMLSHHRPSFGFSYFSLFAEPEMVRHADAEFWIIDTPHESWSVEMARFMRRVAYANIALLSLAALLVFLLSRECGFGFPASATAAALMMFNPRVGFYVQSVWPEILHLAMMLAAFSLFAMALRRQSAQKWAGMFGWLLLCGFVLAYARLTRGVVGPLAWVLSAMIAWVIWRSARPTRRGHRLMAAGLAAAALWISFEGTLWPQRQANLEAYGSTLIGHNLWRNIEGGVGRVPGYAAQYQDAASDPLTREQLARERVIQRVLSQPIGQTIARQVRSFFQRLTFSYYHRGFRDGRWKNSGEKTRITGSVAVSSWCLFVAGILGIGLRGFGNPLRTSLSLFSLYYMAGLFLVIQNPRMFVALVPFLAIFSAGAIDTALGWLHGKREPTTGRDRFS